MVNNKKRYNWGLPAAVISTFILLSCGNGDKEAHEEDEHHDIGAISLSEHQIKEFGIETELVEPGKFNEVIKTSGIIEVSGSDAYTVTAKKSGIITLSSGINEGVGVNAGGRIGVISSEGVQGGDVNKAASVNLKAAKSEYERLKPLYEDGLVTASVFREAERAYQEAEAMSGKGITGGTSAVISDRKGTLVNLQVRSGQYVEVGQPIATVVENSRQVLKAELPARESRHLSHLTGANFIPEGGTLVKLNEHEGKKLSEGTNTSLNNGYIPIYFSFNGNSITSPGGYAEVYLLCGERDGVISVAREALVEIQGNKYVYVQEEGHGYEKRLVKTGASDGERIEVTEGLEPGETIVARGASVVRMAEVSSVAPPSHTHNH